VPSVDVVQAAFPQLEIIELIGAGGMGAVFKARQPKLDRFVALKVLSPSLAASPAFAERFNREARVLARLDHPSIVNVFDFGAVEPSSSSAAVVQASSLPAGSATSPNVTTPLYFLLMEYVDGVNLRQAMTAGRFTPTQALALVPKICEALQFAHDEGILHRDIKPENILLDTRGRLKIADFGIAKLVGEPTAHTRLTATGAAVGTPQYMAPEQLERPGDVDQRADIYSLGVVFYEMLTGELPIERFAPPSAKAAVDSRVDEVVFRALEKERERRYRNAGEVKTSVEHLTQPPAPPPASTAPPFDSAKDFVFCPPQLPRMAQAIIVYALVAFPGIAGVVLGAMALSELRAVSGEQRGTGFALVGVGGPPTVLFQLFLIAAVAVPLSLLSPNAPQRVVPLAMSIGPVAGMIAGLASIHLVRRQTAGAVPACRGRASAAESDRGSGSAAWRRLGRPADPRAWLGEKTERSTDNRQACRDPSPLPKSTGAAPRRRLQQAGPL
jgi:hypothetical protein